MAQNKVTAQIVIKSRATGAVVDAYEFEFEVGATRAEQALVASYIKRLAGEAMLNAVQVDALVKTDIPGDEGAMRDILGKPSAPEWQGVTAEVIDVEPS